jgi:2-oxo-3-(phosphooxy)propyl 3-oxoalkanoate synthase
MDHLDFFSTVDFSSTIDRSLVHRRAIAEVFVTSHVQLDADTFDFGVQVPRQHVFYGDALAGRADHDPLFFVEACRQSSIALAHEYFDVPLNKHFVLREANMQVSDPTLLAAEGQRPTNAVARCRVRRRFRGRDQKVAGLRVRFVVLVGGREVLECEFAYSWLSADDWETLRRDNRTRLGLPATPDQCPPSLPAAPASVGRRDPSNVVISPVELDTEGSAQALLVVDTGNPTMFDHPLDHVPGMLQLEAIRQLSLAVMCDRHGRSPTDGTLLAINAKFRGFAEHDLPVHCRSAVQDGVLDDGVLDNRVRDNSVDDDRVNLRCAVIQDGRTLVEADVWLGYPVERRSRPVAAGWPMSRDLDDVLATTRTVRRKLIYGRPVDREMLRECLSLALYAPNGGNRQDWRFLFVDEVETKKAIARHYRAAFAEYWTPERVAGADESVFASARLLADRLHEVPVLLLGCVRGRLPENAPAARRSSFFGSIYPALWSFMLAARSRGLGTALTTVHLAYERDVAEAVGIPYDEVTQVAMLAVGHLAAPIRTVAPRLPPEQVLAWNRWCP